MGKSQIEWTDATWNPATGCTKVSPGCAHCYIERTPPFRVNHRRFDAKGAIPIQLHPERLTQPLRWKQPRRVFVNSLSDLFHEDIPFSFIDAVFVTMALCPSHAFQILTKRPERMLEFFNFHFPHVGNTKQRIGALMEAVNLPKNGRAYPRYIESWPLKNVWLGVTAENQRFVDERIPLLLQTPAAVRFVSYEPALGPVDFRSLKVDGYEKYNCLSGIHKGQDGITYCLKAKISWVICGGESGPGARPMNPEWARSVRDQCVAAGVPFFFKQWGGINAKFGGRMFDGREWNEYPKGA